MKEKLTNKEKYFLIIKTKGFCIDDDSNKWIHCNDCPTELYNICNNTNLFLIPLVKQRYYTALKKYIELYGETEELFDAIL